MRRIYKKPADRLTHTNLLKRTVFMWSIFVYILCGNMTNGCYKSIIIRLVFGGPYFSILCTSFMLSCFHFFFSFNIELTAMGVRVLRPVFLCFFLFITSRVTLCQTKNSGRNKNCLPTFYANNGSSH